MQCCLLQDVPSLSSACLSNRKLAELHGLSQLGAVVRRYIIDAVHDLAELDQDSDLWTAVYPLDWETLWTPEERLATAQQVLDDMRRLCLVNVTCSRSSSEVVLFC